MRGNHAIWEKGNKISRNIVFYVEKRTLPKELFIAFFSDCYVPNPKVHAKPPI